MVVVTAQKKNTELTSLINDITFAFFCDLFPTFVFLLIVLKIDKR